MSRPISGTGGTSNLADWLPLLGSIVHALRSAGDHRETTPESPPEAESQPSPGTRPDPKAEEPKG